jgi:hypothetical protein
MAVTIVMQNPCCYRPYYRAKEDTKNSPGKGHIAVLQEEMARVGVKQKLKRQPRLRINQNGRYIHVNYLNYQMVNLRWKVNFDN